LSEKYPEKSLKRLFVVSAMPSIIPIKFAPTPRTDLINIGIRGYIISEEKSLKKLAMPRI
jgi:hypothetical protein